MNLPLPSLLLGIIVLTGCDSNKTSGPDWMVGEWIPDVSQTKMTRELTAEEMKEIKRPMALLEQLEMFDHCHLRIRKDSITYLFSDGNQYNRTVPFTVEKSTDRSADILLAGDNERWTFRKTGSPSTIILGFGPHKTAEFPWKKK